MDFSAEEEKKISLYFHISILIKGAISLAEIVVGVLVLFVPVSYFTNLMLRMVQSELVEEPANFIATHVTALAHELSVAGSTFIALYLLSRGLIKLALIVALLKNQLWAYPSSLVALALLVGYQCYQIATTHSPAIIALTIFDLVVMWFIWREYQVLRAHSQGEHRHTEA